MLILLPPSEGKAAPRRGRPLDVASLGWPELTPARDRVRAALVDLCAGDPARAAAVLDVPKTRLDLVALNAHLDTAPTARADAVYTGVLYEALGLASLSAAGKRRATSRVAIVSSLFGLLRPGDRVPAYRLSGDATLPGLGSVAGVWRDALGPAVAGTVGGGLLVDLRSTTYAAFWRPPTDLAARVATVRVLHEVAGRRQVVSHFNKATKGRLVRALLEDGANPRTPPPSPASCATWGGRSRWRPSGVGRGSTWSSATSERAAGWAFPRNAPGNDQGPAAANLSQPRNCAETIASARGRVTKRRTRTSPAPAGARCRAASTPAGRVVRPRHRRTRSAPSPTRARAPSGTPPRAGRRAPGRRAP